MRSCCSSRKKDKQCIRKSDGKIFKLPRRFSKKRCKQGIKGFTMKSSCAPYKDCLKGGSRRLTYKKNILGKPLKKCSVRTGFYRDGFCMTGPEDLGTHTVCAKMDRRFLDFTAKQGNDLSSVIKPRQKWCLCENRWLEAYKKGYAPKVIKSATNMRTEAKIRKLINKQKGGNPQSKKIAYFAGGCFWGLESKFKKVDGVLDTEVGYMGGKSGGKTSKSKYTKKKVTYEQVCSGKTGHAETVKVVYDPKKISFNQLVELFFSFHDPTTRNKQGPDIGTQYRSIAFYSTKQEQDIIKQYIQQSPKHIVTEVKKKTTFHKAEEYHQNYNEKHMKGGKEISKKTLRKQPQLPQLRKLDKSNKTHIYKLNDPQKKRILAIDEGIRDEMRKGKTKREAALSKKKRFNVLRLYRKNKDPDGCRKLTQDMTYMDKKYDTGTTNDICKKKGGSSKTKKKQFLFNPDSPKKSFDVYLDKNPKDTIPIKYKTVKDVKQTIKKLERLYKQGRYDHKRIWQVGMIMYVRLKVLKKKKRQQYNLAKKYFEFLGKRTDIKNETDRKKYKFNI